MQKAEENEAAVTYLNSIMSPRTEFIQPPQVGSDIAAYQVQECIMTFYPTNKTGVVILQPDRDATSVYVMYPHAKGTPLKDEDGNPFAFFNTPTGTAITGLTKVDRYWISSKHMPAFNPPMDKQVFVKGRVVAGDARLWVAGVPTNVNVLVGTLSASVINDTRQTLMFTDSQLKTGSAIEKDNAMNVGACEGIRCNLGPFIRNDMGSLNVDKTYTDEGSTLISNIMRGKFVPGIECKELPSVDLHAVSKNIWISSSTILDPSVFDGTNVVVPEMELTCQPAFTIYYTAMDPERVQEASTTLLVTHYFATEFEGSLIVTDLIANRQRFTSSSTANYSPIRPGNSAIDTKQVHAVTTYSQRPPGSQWIGTNVALLFTVETAGAEIAPLEHVSLIGINQIDLIQRNLTYPGMLQATVMKWSDLGSGAPLSLTIQYVVGAVVGTLLSRIGVKPKCSNKTAGDAMSLVQSLFLSNSLNTRLIKRIYKESDYQKALEFLAILGNDPSLVSRLL